MSQPPYEKLARNGRMGEKVRRCSWDSRTRGRGRVLSFLVGEWETPPPCSSRPVGSSKFTVARPHPSILGTTAAGGAWMGGLQGLSGPVSVPVNTPPSTTTITAVQRPESSSCPVQPPHLITSSSHTLGNSPRRTINPPVLLFPSTRVPLQGARRETACCSSLKHTRLPHSCITTFELVS